MVTVVDWVSVPSAQATSTADLESRPAYGWNDEGVSPGALSGRR